MRATGDFWIQPKLSAQLGDTLRQINRSADQVSAGAEQVSAGAQALSRGATEQASAIEELAATINDISGKIIATADRAGMSQSGSETGREVEQCNEQMRIGKCGRGHRRELFTDWKDYKNH
ncbi:MAG: hypothetical protein ACLTBV_21505 [Enterocloster bolteae]